MFLLLLKITVLSSKVQFEYDYCRVLCLDLVEISVQLGKTVLLILVQNFNTRVAYVHSTQGGDTNNLMILPTQKNKRLLTYKLLVFP